MAKKHWIYVKRGLSEDPKHRQTMDRAVWVFLHIIDRADWETGKVFDWRDEDEAADMGLNPRTLRDWRQRLVELKYIQCDQKQHSLEITIFKWINPRDYSAKTINTPICGGNARFQGDTQGDTTTAPSSFQGDTQGDTQGDSEHVTPSLDSKTKPIDIEKDPVFEILRQAAIAIWPMDPMPWRQLVRDMENARYIREDHTIKITGMGEKAAFYQDRFALIFERQLTGILNEKTNVIFEE